MLPTVVDDAILLAVLARQAEPVVQEAAEAGQILTTASWYYRLAERLVVLLFVVLLPVLPCRCGAA